jgi:multiple sugar transport system substrate-binding protein
MVATGAATGWTRRWALARGALAGLGGVLAVACGAAGPATDRASPGAQPVDLRVHLVKKSDVSDWSQTGLDQDIDGWKQKHPKTNVILETVAGFTAEFNPQIISFAASGTLGDVTWSAPRHRSHIAWGTKYKIVRELSSLASAAKFDLGQIAKGAIENSTWEGKLYWWVYISEPVVPVIAVNTAKAEQLGLKVPSDDWTFADLTEWAKRATTQDAFGYFRADSGTAPFGMAPFLRQWGVEPVSADGTKATFAAAQEAFVNALGYRYNLTNTLKVSPNPKDGPIDAPALFGNGKVLAMDCWPFRIQGLPATYKDLQVDFVLTPTVKKGEKRRSMLNEHVFGVTTASKHPAEAFEFLTWIGGKEMNVQGLVQAAKGPIARGDVWADPRVTDRWPAFKKLKPVMDAIEPDFLVANWRGIDFDNAFSGVAFSMEKGETAAAAAATEIQRLCQEVLDKEPV